MVSLADAKLYLRVDFADDDAVIERLVTSASDHLKSQGVDMGASPIPPAIEQAVLMLVSHFYNNSGATIELAQEASNNDIDRLIAPYRECGI